jgi:hypothetical protein
MGEEKVKRRGPKPLSEDVKRTITVCTWMNQEEFDKFKALCQVARMRKGPLLREAVLNFGGDIGPKNVPEFNVKVWTELSRAASNLNQIAKRLNRGDMLEIEEIKHALKEFRFRLMGAQNESQD